MSSPTPNLTVHHLQVGQGERIPFLLEELGIPYKLKLYQRSPLLSPPELKAQHPMGTSPLLEDATLNPEKPLMLAESGAIVEYIVHRYGGGRLALAPDHPNFADYLYWFHFSNSSLQPALFRRALTRGFVGGDEKDPRYQFNDGKAKAALQLFDQRLRENTWLAGEEFTAADVMNMWCLSTLRKFEPIDLTEYLGILAWLKRVSERPAYQKAVEKADPDLNIAELVSANGPSQFGGGVYAKMIKPPREKL